MRRKKPYSRRPKKLTEEQEERVDFWYTHERTFAYMAKQLGISERTLYRYVGHQHKQKKERINIDALAEHLMSVGTDVPLGTNEANK